MTYTYSPDQYSRTEQILKQLEGYSISSGISVTTNIGVKLHLFTCHELEAGPKSFSCRSERRNKSPLFSFVAPTNVYMCCCFIVVVFYNKFIYLFISKLLIIIIFLKAKTKFCCSHSSRIL